MIIRPRSSVAISTLAAILLTGSSIASGAMCPHCPTDLDGDGETGSADLATLLAAWGPCEACPEDVDDDGAVGAADLAQVLADWGACPVFDFGDDFRNEEAAQIGLEMLGPSGPLVLPAITYDRVLADLDAIRDVEPDLQDQPHSMAWIPNRLIVKITDGTPQDQYDCLNDYYSVVDEQFLFSSGGGSWWVITFASDNNVAALASVYAALDVVEFAEPDALIGGQNYYDPLMIGGGVWRWTIDDGWHDCFDGCDCHRLYTFEVDAEGNVDLISFEEFGAAWCDFGK